MLCDCIKHIAIKSFGNHHHIFLLFVNFSPVFSGPSLFNFPIYKSLKTSGKTNFPLFLTFAFGDTPSQNIRLIGSEQQFIY